MNSNIVQREIRWIPVEKAKPQHNDKTDHHPISVLAVIDDPKYRVNGDDPFVDTVSYWPALDRWTCTHQSRADQDADDYPCIVSFWQYFDPIPGLPAPDVVQYKAKTGPSRWKIGVLDREDQALHTVVTRAINGALHQDENVAKAAINAVFEHIKQPAHPSEANA